VSQEYPEGRLTFRFPEDWQVCRPERTSFYSRHFQHFCGGSGAVDFLAFDPEGLVLWLIEVKDYAAHPRTKQQDLADEVAVKTRDVLAMLPVGNIRDNSMSQPGKLQIRDFWQAARRATAIRVVLHCELPASRSRLFPGVKDSANLQTKLTQRLRCVDPRALLTSRAMGHPLPWAAN
jgi:hypothetical protein